MKPQDILFIVVVIVLLFTRNPKLFLRAGLVCLFVSIPFFAFWVFFTAERLVLYAAAFILLAILFFLFQKR